MSDIEELKRERDGWNEVYMAFVVDNKSGKREFKRKHEDCGLCPKYKVEDESGYISCRECPIVKLTRRTCNYWWGIHGIEQGKTETGSAALTTYLWLKDMIEKAEAKEVD
jgi:hypothetical protein